MKEEVSCHMIDYACGGSVLVTAKLVSWWLQPNAKLHGACDELDKLSYCRLLRCARDRDGACECCARGDRGSPMGGGEGMGLARRLALGSLAQLGADTTLAAPKDFL